MSRKTIFIGGFVIILFLFSLFYLVFINDESKSSIKIITNENLSSLDIHTFKTKDELSLARLISEGLYTLNKDMNIVPALAVSYNVSDDGLKYVINLRNNVQFQDGSSLDAHVATRNFIRQKKIADDGVGLNLLYNVESISAISDYSLMFQLKEPQSEFIVYLSSPNLSIVSDDSLKNNLKTISSTSKYKILYFKEYKDIVLVPNINYWDKTLNLNKVPIRISGIANVDEKIKSIKNKTAQLVTDININSINQLDNSTGLIVTSTPSIKMHYIAINNDSVDLQNVRLKSVIAQSINRNKYVTDVLSGYGNSLYSILSPIMYGYISQQNFYEPKNPDNASIITAIKKSTTYTMRSELNEKATNFILDSLLSIGLNVIIDNNVANPDFYLFSYSPEIAEPIYMFKDLLTASGKFNFAKYSSPNISRYLIVASQSKNMNERLNSIQSLQNFITQNNNLIPIAYENHISVKQKGLLGDYILSDSTFILDNIKFIE